MDWKSLAANRIVKLLSAGTFAASVFFVQPYRPMVFVGQSMSPTYANKQVALATTDTTNLKRGDIVILEGDDGTLVKRIEYLPGDWIEYFQFGGKWIMSKSLNFSKFRHPDRFARKRVRIPEGYVFVLGDNRQVSVDSRQLGVLPISSIRAKLVAPKPREVSKYSDGNL